MDAKANVCESGLMSYCFKWMDSTDASKVFAAKMANRLCFEQTELREGLS